MSLSRQSIELVLTTNNKEAKHHIHPKHKPGHKTSSFAGSVCLSWPSARKRIRPYS